MLVLYLVLILLFTGLGILFAPSSAQVGSTRPEDTIPEHLLALTGFGLLLGIGGMLIYGRKGLPLVVLTPVLTVGLDLDHLPAYLGYSQTIRPAHSLVFFAAALVLTAIMIKAPDMELVVASAFMGHMAVDTGLFAPFSPISFQYFPLGPYRLAFAGGALLCALGAGAILRLGGRDSIKGGGRTKG